jgi:hypothetical protein
VGWLFAQLWFLLLLAFLLGSAVATLVVGAVSAPVEQVVRQLHRERGGR